MQHDVIVVGAGPAGMAAARAARNQGERVLLVDDNPGLGGQIWRGREDLRLEGVELGLGKTLTEWRGEAKRLILACGARELLLPFPGWTLPHVVGAGGLQALVKQGLAIQGKRVVVCGSGPLLLAVATNLRKAGAEVLRVAEQAPWKNLFAFGLGLWRWPEKIFEALGYATPVYRAGLWPVEAWEGGVTLSDGSKMTCDYVACGFGLVANGELARLLGCRMNGSLVEVDDWQRTSVEGVYAVGEMTGIGGVEKAEAEGRAAGARQRVTEKWRSFATALTRTFALRDELRALAKPDTIVCRCEDVRWGRIAAMSGKRQARLEARCGMGACQGRLCGPALEWMCGWGPENPRPPLFPVSVREFLGDCDAPGHPPAGNSL
jgi:NADPH-dependent 2,4-dienoyl-CoA reductase/sulfur reductase-like enzyme